MVRAQITFEFLVYTGIVVMVLLIVGSISSYHFTRLNKEYELKQFEKNAENIKDELYTALNLEDGYSREFYLPSRYNYTVRNRSVVIHNQDSARYNFFLGIPLNGNLNPGKNTITKKEGRIYVNEGTGMDD